MPYISQEQREYLNLLQFSERHSDYRPPVARTPGELNYQLTQLIMAYVLRYELSYQIINDVVGALEGAKAEFQRRVVATYENEKIKLNGDVY